MTIEKEVTQKFDDHLVKPDLFLEEIWFEHCNGSVSWNSENSIDDLINGDGQTYCEESYADSVEIDGFVLFTLGDSCGGQGQVIFKLSNKIDPKDYE